MCLLCHQVDPKEAVEMLQESLKKAKYDEWNTTSLSHILLCIHGLDGDEAHGLANQLAENFYRWYLGYSYGCWERFYKYTPRTGLEAFPSSAMIREMIDDANKFYQEHKDKSREEKLKMISGGRKLHSRA